MRKRKATTKKIKLLGLIAIGSVIGLLSPSKTDSAEAARVTGSHIGTFDGSTTFTTTSRNGINPGLFIEVMDDDGNLTQYESEEGVITIPETKEGAYVTQAKLLGKTKYVDEDTGEILNQWEEGRNLRLESSESPDLMTTGANIVSPENIKVVGCDAYDVDKQGLLNVVGDTTGYWARSYCVYSYQMKANKTYYIYCDGESTGRIHVEGWIDNVNSGAIRWNGFYKYTPTEDVLYTAKIFFNRDESPFTCASIRIGVFETPTQPNTFEPYQSSTLTVNEDVTLSGFGDIRDTLDLITGEVTKRIGETVLDGNANENWTLNTIYDINDTYVKFILRNVPNDMLLKNSLSHWIANRFKNQLRVSGVPNEEGISSEGNMNAPLMITIKRDKLTESTPEGFKRWLVQNPVTVQYELTTPAIQTITLASTYQFKTVPLQTIDVNGSILPLVATITVPMDSLSFNLDPNQEAGQQFIAPDFSITNNTLAPLQIELKSFEQTTDVLNDVLPDKYDSWDGLNKKQSQDIALALEPIPSDGWLSLNEGVRYVADHSNYALGEIKANSTVEFAFSALHGQSFVEPLTPQYRLTFIFDQK